LANSRELTVVSAVSRIDRLRLLVGCYTTAVTSALAVEGELNTTTGAILCALLVVVLLNHHLASLGAEFDSSGVFLVLALLPLAGLLSVVMPVAHVSPAAWPLVVGAPLLLALVLAAEQLGLGRDRVGLTLKYPAYQLGIGALGIPLGLLAFVGLRPEPLSGSVALAVVALSVLAFAEELLFRGLLQPALCRLYGAAGIEVTSLLSASVALGVHSLPYALFVWLVSMGFGVATERTGSIAGTTVARTLMFIGLLIVWPHVLG
jgi:uncharacterized protein